MGITIAEATGLIEAFTKKYVKNIPKAIYFKYVCSPNKIIKNETNINKNNTLQTYLNTNFGGVIDGFVIFSKNLSS